MPPVEELGLDVESAARGPPLVAADAGGPRIGRRGPAQLGLAEGHPAHRQPGNRAGAVRVRRVQHRPHDLHRAVEHIAVASAEPGPLRPPVARAHRDGVLHARGEAPHHPVGTGAGIEGAPGPVVHLDLVGLHRPVPGQLVPRQPDDDAFDRRLQVGRRPRVIQDGHPVRKIGSGYTGGSSPYQRYFVGQVGASLYFHPEELIGVVHLIVGDVVNPGVHALVYIAPIALHPAEPRRARGHAQVAPTGTGPAEERVAFLSAIHLLSERRIILAVSVLSRNGIGRLGGQREC